MLEKRITDLIEPVIQDLGLVLWSCQLHQQKKSALLRIYIDRAVGGVSLDDCTKVSREVGAILDVEDVMQTRYSLEVSSPGLERTLSTIAHFQKYIGAAVKIKLRHALDDQKNLEAIIEKIEQDTIFLKTQNTILPVKLSDIQKANLLITDNR